MTKPTEYQIFSKSNKDRIGQTVLGLDGEEIINTIVLSDSCYAHFDPQAEFVEIQRFSRIGGSSSSIVLTKESFDLLRNWSI